MRNKVLILISTYNGEKYLKEQLDSLIKQKNVDLSIFIRDDGSKDNTVDIINEYKTKYPKIELCCDKNVGYARSFWNLIKLAKLDFDYYAFCDQDDIWLDNKMYAAIKMIEENNTHDDAVLYTSRVISTNNSKEIISKNTFNTNRVINVYESFQKSIIPGCVFVFNKKALILLKKYDGFMESHDWATYCIINTLGKVIYDKNSYINYRIHDNNTIGKKNDISVFLERFFRFFKKNKCVRSKFAKDFYNTYNDMLNDNDMKKSIEHLAFYQNSFKYKIRLIFNKKFKGFIFKIYVLLNKV